MTRLDRYRGCLLAGGIGDQLGNDVEFMRRSEMLRLYGDAGVHTMSAHITDDTQMTLFTAEGMLMGVKHGMPMPACVYQSYLDWYATQSNRAKGGVFRKESTLMREQRLYALRAPGNTCLSALRSGDIGLIDEPINDSKGCGGVMRTAPCGLLKVIDTEEPEDVYALQGAQAAAITHGHLMGYVPAAMLSDMVHQIMMEAGRTLKEITVDSLRRVVRMFGASQQMVMFNWMITRAMELAETQVPAHEAIRELGEGWVGDEALAIAVYCVLKYPNDMEASLAAAVTHDGDSDSTGAIAGNILGAWLGVRGIPSHWLERLEMREVIDDMAIRLYEAANK